MTLARLEKPKLKLCSRDFRVLVEAVKEAEEHKPSQDAKRRVFARHGVLGTPRDRVLTAVFYDVMKRMAILDKAIQEATGANPLILDPWLRAALRVALDVIHYHRPARGTLRHLRWGVAALLSEVTHPYVGMYYWDLFPRLAKAKPRPRTREEALEHKYLLPAWLIRKLKKLVGSEFEDLVRAFDMRLPLSVRVNTLKATVEEVVEELRREGKEPRVSDRVPVVVKFEGPYDFDKSRLYREGKIIVQEEAAAAAALVLDPKPGEVVVDMCAAPGGKTSHMAELMKNQGVIHAFDVDRARMRRMKELLERMGITIVKQHLVDAATAPKILGEEVADKVLLDPPCSSTGTIMKNPELRWRVREDGIEEIVREQRRLLQAAVKLLKPGGRLLYTTCSLLPEENEENVKWLLNRYPELRLVEIKGPYSPGFMPGTMRAWPHKHNTIGFFYALLEKKG